MDIVLSKNGVKCAVFKIYDVQIQIGVRFGTANIDWLLSNVTVAKNTYILLLLKKY